jgi:hypothetical protein
MVKRLKKTAPEPPDAVPEAAPGVEAALRALEGARHLAEAGRRLRNEFPDCAQTELLAALRAAHRRITEAWLKSPARKAMAKLGRDHRGETHEDDQ